MANRRMFSKSIVQSSRFLRMPATSRLLYYDLGMASDDDGYCEWYPVLQMTAAKEQDMEVLQANKFIIVYDTEVLMIKDWKENNQIRLDRYQPSKFLGKYTTEPLLKSGIPNGNQMATEVRLGKDSIGKVSKGKDTNTIAPKIVAEGSKDIVEIIDAFKPVNPSYEKWFGNKTQRGAIERMLKVHGKERLLKVIEFLPKSNTIPFVATITSPYMLEEKWADLEANLTKVKNKSNFNRPRVIL